MMQHENIVAKYFKFIKAVFTWYHNDVLYLSVEIFVSPRGNFAIFMT